MHSFPVGATKAWAGIDFTPLSPMSLQLQSRASNTYACVNRHMCNGSVSSRERCRVANVGEKQIGAPPFEGVVMSADLGPLRNGISLR